MIETLEKEKFESIKKLADLNVAISETKESFLNLENEEAKYIAKREKKVQGQIDKLFKNSAELLEKTQNNYREVSDFCNIVISYKEFLDENYGKFKKILEDFNERSDLWDKQYEEQVHEFSRQEKLIKEDEERVKRSREDIEKANEQIKRDRILLEDRKQTLERSIERLKSKK